MSQQAKYTGRVWLIEADVQPGTTETIELPLSSPCVIAIHTGPDQTALVEFSLSSVERIRAITPAWWIKAATDAGAGVIPANTSEAIPFEAPITAIRVTAPAENVDRVAVEVQQ
jgi:hypothetical protein